MLLIEIIVKLILLHVVLCCVETLFSVNGKIKKIKIYTFPDGRKKGDALVTFTKLEAVALACLQVCIVCIG